MTAAPRRLWTIYKYVWVTYVDEVRQGLSWGLYRAEGVVGVRALPDLRHQPPDGDFAGVTPAPQTSIPARASRHDPVTCAAEVVDVFK
jgi:hypothetical protein